MNNTADTAVATKAELERLKLQAEVTRLNRPFWRDPTYLALLTPLIIAAWSIYIGFNTQFFDLQKERLALQKENLTRETGRLEDRKEALQVEVRAFEETKAELELELATLRTKLENAELYFALDGLSDDADGVWFHDPRVETLVDLARAEPTAEVTLAAIDEYLQPALPPTTQAALLYVIVEATGDDAAFDSFLDLTRSDAALDDFRFFRSTGPGQWPVAYRERLLETSLDLLQMAQGDARRTDNVLNWYSNTFGFAADLPTFADHPYHGEAVATLERLARDGDANVYDRTTALNSLMLFAPARALPVIALMSQDPVMVSHLSNTGLLWLEALRERLDHLDGPTDFPGSLNEQYWRTWLAQR